MKLERTFIPYTPIAKHNVKSWNLIVRCFEERGPIGHKPLNKTDHSIYFEERGPMGHKPLNRTDHSTYRKDAYYII
jgi:hypothetical protein